MNKRNKNKITLEDIQTVKDTPIERIINMLDSQENWFDLRNVKIKYIGITIEHFQKNSNEIPRKVEITIPYKTTELTLLISIFYMNPRRIRCGICVEDPVVRPYRKTESSYGKRWYKYSSTYSETLKKIRTAYTTALPVLEEQHKRTIQQQEKERFKEKIKQQTVENLNLGEKYLKQQNNYLYGSINKHRIMYNERNKNNLEIVYDLKENNTRYELKLEGLYTIEETKQLINFLNYSQHNVLEKLQGIGI